MADFPPRPEHPREVASFVEAFASTIDKRTAIYVSSPLTTGQRAIDWLARSGRPGIADVMDESFRLEVFEPNRASAQQYVRSLRQRVKDVVIDPTAVAEIGKWTQDDYRVAWGDVIARYCASVIFLEHWQYSSGCAYEAVVAHSSGADMLTPDLSPLTLETARRLIRRAIGDSEKRGADVAFLRTALAAFDEPSRAARA